MNGRRAVQVWHSQYQCEFAQPTGETQGGKVVSSFLPSQRGGRLRNPSEGKSKREQLNLLGRRKES